MSPSLPIHSASQKPEPANNKPADRIVAGIVALGAHVPARTLTNDDLAATMDTSDAWITSRTGITARRIAADDDFASDLAIAAVKDLQARHNSNTETKKDAAESDGGVLAGVDMVIVATNTPDALFPATAALVQDYFGLQAGAFDLLTGCAGWLYALSVARGYVEAGIHQRVLVIGAEVLSKIMDWEDRTTAVLFGDGAGAAIVAPVAAGYGFQVTLSGADGSKADHIRSQAIARALPGGASLTPHIQMNGREVFKFAVRLLETVLVEMAARANMALEDITLFVPHQANLRILDAAREQLGLDEERFVVILDRYANNSTASIPLALTHAVDDGRLEAGDTVAMISFGAGLTWSATLLTWGELD